MTEDEKEKVFTNLVQQSWHYYGERFRNRKLDEVLLGAVITAYVKIGFMLIDLNSDGTNHFLRFENPDDNTRLLVKLNNLSEDFISAKVQGHLAEVEVGYGEKAGNMSSVWNAFKNEFKSAFILTNEPGVVSFDADITGGYIYANLPLILNLDNYLESHYSIKVADLTRDLDCVVHSLRKYLRGRLNIAAGV
ncbi:MAG: hypothetical protein AB7S38_30950 [Vulcanimicrobiota bacterium]